MKKNKISFETQFWAGFETTNLFETVEAFFDYAHLDYYKQTLSETVIYSYKGKIYRRDDLSQIFVFYLAVRSFLKVCFLLRAKSKKWKVKESEKNKSVLHLASLSKEEYENPFIVFDKAFYGKTVKEFEIFLCEIVHLSMSSSKGNSDLDLITPYIYLVKMLDAVRLLLERGIEKIKKEEQLGE